MSTATRTFTDARTWVRIGTGLLLDAVAGLDEAAFKAPSALPDWTRKHLVAHVAANADPLCNLVHRAATGEPDVRLRRGARRRHGEGPRPPRHRTAVDARPELREGHAEGPGP
ncbi:maleylpyruvate isomerase N-terminal domain-containing protein [Streptomyces hyderabadensis]|uniref:Mycothiol-dependent maleylpyruvate isomerase metal-binding domain-containing protein n=1 Tax=Streptomyces hyderabadensis TaxID=598549 RepID=A0ABP9HH43_9ACTN|nr:maleylpyruvate isomerase N-terminal domain-containing protein [Streptomyces hyderabadensis]